MTTDAGRVDAGHRDETGSRARVQWEGQATMKLWATNVLNSDQENQTKAMQRYLAAGQA